MTIKEDKEYPIGKTIWLIVLIALLFFVGNATLNAFDEGNPFTLFGIIMTVGIFIFLVVIVKALMKGDGSDK